MLLALIFAAAAVAPEAADHISGSAITAIFTGMAAVISAIGTKIFANAGFNRRFAARERELRTEIAEELRAKILNDPLHVEQSGYQAMMKENATDHADIFNRLRNNESAIATLMERSITQGKILDRMADQVGSLYDRIICGGKKK